MDKNLYEMIFKRKSFHLFRDIGNEHLTKDELKDIEKEFSKLKPLVEDIVRPRDEALRPGRALQHHGHRPRCVRLSGQLQRDRR